MIDIRTVQLARREKMLGVVVTSYNDGFKLNEWLEHYSEIRSVVDKYVIVDNGSKEDYIQSLHCSFPDAVIIKLGANKGTTGAYNAGISYLLNCPEINYIMLLGNDIKIDIESIRRLIEALKHDHSIGMIGPTILKKDSTVIEDAGCDINLKHYALRLLHAGDEYDDNVKDIVYVDTVAGGVNIATKRFYETVGLQDEMLFMYSDEVDMRIRAKKKGFKIAVLNAAVAWHQHINPKNTVIRPPYSAYLIARNKIYLGYKHGNFFKALYLFLYDLGIDLKHTIIAVRNKDKETIVYRRWHFIGAFNGLIHNMKKNKYSSLEG